MATELQVLVLVRVTVNAPLVQVSLVPITRTGSHTYWQATRINVNALQPKLLRRTLSFTVLQLGGVTYRMS